MALRILLSAVLVSVCCSVASAVTNGRSPRFAPDTPMVDVRKDGYSLRVVAFCSHEKNWGSGDERSYAGHAFVAIGTMQFAGEFHMEEAFGFYRDIGDVPPLVGELPSMVHAENTSSLAAATCKLLVQVDDAQMSFIRAKVKDWGKYPYILGLQDCVTLQSEIAQGLGLAVPDRKSFTRTFPSFFTTALAKMNASRAGTVTRMPDRPPTGRASRPLNKSSKEGRGDRLGSKDGRDKGDTKGGQNKGDTKGGQDKGDTRDGTMARTKLG